MSTEPDSTTPPVVAISGAGKGLGRAYAHRLAARGWRVIVNNRTHAGDTEHSADRVVGEVIEAGGEAIADYSDALDPEAGQRMLGAALETWGRIDAVIANAGISEARTFHKQNRDEFEQVVAINQTGTIDLVRPIFKHLYEQGSGAVVVSTSAAGLVSEHGLPGYSTAKAALIGFMRSLALEGRSHGLRVNAIAPFAATQMTEEALPEEIGARMRPELVAPVAEWLIDPSCPANGEVVVCGGGRIARTQTLVGTPAELGGDADPASITAWFNAQESQNCGHAYRGANDMFRGFITEPVNGSD